MSKGKQKKKEHETCEEFNPDQNEYFYYIAGYTAGGVPYGITWDEARRDGLLENEESNVKYNFEDVIAQAEFIDEALLSEDEYEDSPTPGFSFGMRMGCVRDDAGLSRNKMAKSLGIAPSTWKNYEEDITFPSVELMMKFCELYGVNPHWLMTNCGEMYKDTMD